MSVPVNAPYPRHPYYSTSRASHNTPPYRHFGQNFALSPTHGSSFTPIPTASTITGEEVEDPLLDPRQHLSRREILTYLSMGFTLGITGKEILRLFAQKKQTNFDGEITLRADPKNEADPSTKKAEKPTDPFEIPPVQIWRYYKDPLPSMMRAVQEDPTLAKGLLAYTGIGILGYLSGSLVKGTKETWVRREETKIRAHLVDKMRAVVNTSIRTKHAFNNQLRQDTKTQLLKMLAQNNIMQPEELLNLVSSPVPSDAMFFYQPTHRTIPKPPAFNYFGHANSTHASKMLGFGHQMKDSQTDNSSDAPALLLMQKFVIAGVGLLLGMVVQNFIRLFTDALSKTSPARKTDNNPEAKNTSVDKTDSKTETPAPKIGTNVKTKESIQLNDLENWSLLAFKNKSNLTTAISLFSMTGAASVGSQLIDGLREIEVTRLNAKTELDYQKHNWLIQDPQFHEIAEREAVANDIQLLLQDLPWLRNNREQLKQRIQTILTNVGRNSAPPYFPMTPMVNLVEARA